MRIGLALGGGGVRGLAHLRVLEVLDEMGVKPSLIVGTSMGAIVGSMYAAGYSGSQLREGVRELIISKEDRPGDLWRRKSSLLKWFQFFRLKNGRQAVLSPNGFLEFLLENMGVKTFEELKIPFRAIATDFYREEEVVFSSGDILPAIKASMSIPGVFEPVVHEGRVLVDGGVVNNLPYRDLKKECDAVIAVDVIPSRDPEETDPPSLTDSVMGMFDSLMNEVVRFKLRESPPDIYYRPDLHGVRTLDFDKIEQVYQQTDESIDRFREDLKALLESKGGG
ncbi:MAG: patatin-like phospholipase family protein [Verrucomicrobiales bacterium]|nr:patatin-like phospholipase family protein [Verrucomicrobiales bacterium]